MEYIDRMTPKQVETIGMLDSRIEELEYDPDSMTDNPTDYFFAGYSADGPCCGHVKPNGEIEWMVEG